MAFWANLWNRALSISDFQEFANITVAFVKWEKFDVNEYFGEREKSENVSVPGRQSVQCDLDDNDLLA